MSDVTVDALLRSEFYYFARKCFHTIAPGRHFVPNWHLKAIAHQLERIERGETTRLIVNLPPRSGKSIFVSVAYPAWLLAQDPTCRIIVVSYSNELAADLHRQFRTVLEADWYQRLFPDTLLSKDTALEAVTTVGGGRYATSIEGSLTGRGADLIIIDDPHKAEEAQSEKALAQVWEWYSGTLVSRLNDQRTGKIILVMQRLHQDDLAGRLLARQQWTHLNLPALAPYNQSIPLGNGGVKHWLCDEPLDAERGGREVLEKTKREIGSAKFSAQYLQQPVPKAGNLIQLQWFRRYDQAPVKQAGDRIVQSWDPASGIDDHNDYSVCTTWLVTKEKKYYLLDVFRARINFLDLKRKVRSHALRFAADVILIEKNGIGESLLGEFANNPPGGMVRPVGILPKGGKIDRLAAQSAKIEAGHVYLPADAPWLADLLTEVLAFPNVRHDDQIDSISQFLFWVSSWRGDPPLTISLPVYGD
jgi:predicted phage terminase large subunit-like protein